jgi:excisionase family DNA binding protein
MNYEFEIPLSPWMDKHEAARYLSITPRTLTQYRLDGHIPAYALSEKKILFNRTDLDDFARRRIKLFRTAE